MTDELIRLENLQKAFGDTVVLDGVELSVNRGESLAVIGRSGSGKSVMLKHVLGLMMPTDGDVWCLGTHINTADLRELYHVRARVGYVFQFAALFDSLTVRENVGFFLDNHADKTPEEIDEIVEEKLTQVGLPGTGPLMPASLSGGMKKRAGLARALVGEPEIILYDEPTSGLDPITAAAVNDLINKTKEYTAATTVIITHDMHSAYKTAERIAMLHEGRIIFDGSNQEIRDCEDPRVQQFINGRAEGPIDPLKGSTKQRPQEANL
ncbi:MAG: ATP-binding cassette domain-containing protein [Candidatus Coatesbacteria bacterium]|nr:ATP-binding cassette domain-containing protein [Candidatus Coatesbacteria bacterium]